MDNPRAQDDAEDEDLVSRAAGGDRRAFDQIVARHGAFALRVASRIVPDRPAAEDAVQEAMVRAWSQAGRFDPTRARFRTWLYRIVVNQCLDQRRRAQPVPLPDDFDVVDPGSGADEVMAASEREAALAAALADLPAMQRAVMTLVYDEGVSGAEAGRILGLSVKAVERLLARARSALRVRMQVDHGYEEHRG